MFHIANYDSVALCCCITLATPSICLEKSLFVKKICFDKIFSLMCCNPENKSIN